MSLIKTFQVHINETTRNSSSGIHHDIFTRPVNALGDCSIGGLIPSCIVQEIGDKYEHDKYEHAVLGARIQRILGSSAQNSRKIKHI